MNMPQEVQKTETRCEVGGILGRRHIGLYVEQQNAETSVAVIVFKPQ